MNPYQTVLRVKSSASLLSYYLALQEDDGIDFNAPYQRDYDWSSKEQQSLLQTIFNGLPIGAVSLVVYDSFNSNEAFAIRVVDGKQRLTTLLMYVNNEFPYRFEGQDIYFRDLDRLAKSEFKKTKIPNLELSRIDGSDPTEEDQIRYFYNTNFAGMALSAEHKLKIEQSLAK